MNLNQASIEDFALRSKKANNTQNFNMYRGGYVRPRKFDTYETGEPSWTRIIVWTVGLALALSLATYVQFFVYPMITTAHYD